ncbi:hypothetical protein ACKUG4_08335 [Pseudomonas glycinae]|jgi:hypothetical protein|uniref:hypothetical protein n=1 Tax=Pseudomonas TaxID=286 RepID=UPI0007DD3692|nr:MULTISPECIES: hypothetical protein [Pseudomonas]ANI52585.1 hypothetical protein PDR5_08550 [Pseudomonas sp. DR 5-09]
MKVTYTLKNPVGNRRYFMFEGIVNLSDILKFAGVDQQYIVTKKILSVPFDIEEPITDVMLETEVYKP